MGKRPRPPIILQRGQIVIHLGYHRSGISPLPFSDEGFEFGMCRMTNPFLFSSFRPSLYARIDIIMYICFLK